MGSRRTGNGVERVYDAGRRWVDSALRVDGSLFTPGDAIWTAENLEVLHEKFLNSPDETDRSFLEKLKEQLSGSPEAVFQLMGECLYFYFLIVHTKNGADEKNVIDTVLQWSDSPVVISPELVAALTPGIATPGAAYHRFRAFQVGLLIEFVELLKQEESSRLVAILDDPWEFKRFLMGVRPRSRLVSRYQNASRIQRQALLHLVHPDTFEGIVSEDHKNAIVNAFSTRITEPTEDVDSQLQQIRTSIERELGRDFSFYEDDIRKYWKPKKGESLVKEIEHSNSNGKEPSNLEELAREVYLPVRFLTEMETLLEEKKQVIFQGPPGTGKTFIAKKLARCLAGSGERVKLVQFHPSYAYEDFVQGFRPKMENGQSGFELRDGPLLRIAEKARNDLNNDYYLIIDEINRGNLAKVLGELYFLLEYRDEPVALQYSDKEFRLPKNLYIIATMNTADRSIALVDMALRRRFYFKLFHPDEEPVKNVLREWLKATNPDMEWVAEVVDRVNEKLKDDRHAAIGPSYFMKDDLDDAAVERIWKHSVLPYIEERRFGGGEGDKQDFDLKKLKREASKGEEGADNADSNEQQ